MNILSNIFLNSTASSGGAAAQQSQATIWTYLPFIILIGVIIIFFVLSSKRNKKQQREAQDMLNSISIGDEIITIGGIEGRVVRIKEGHITIESGRDRTKFTIIRQAIANVIKKQENVTVKDTVSIDSDNKPEIKNA